MVKVKQVMRKDVVVVDPHFRLSVAAKIMFNNKVGSVVVVDRKKPVGIITSEDIVSLVANGKDPKTVKVSDMAGKRFVTTSPEENLLRVTKTMIKEGIKRVPVINRGKLVGIVTDKEILVTTPELIGVLSEKLKARVEKVASPSAIISGLCESCEVYSDQLRNLDGRWLCEDCMD